MSNGRSPLTFNLDDHVGYEMSHWRVFVRQQLQRLAEAGHFVVTADTIRDPHRPDSERVLRYVVAPQSADGRSIVVPNVGSLLPPPELPVRATRDLLAPYTIQAPGMAKPTNVPWSRVLRDHKQTEMRPSGICIGCQWGTSCAHGWAVPSPRSIVVLAANNPLTGKQRIGWFVRFDTDKQKLIQVPTAVAKTLTWRMENDVVMCTSSLCAAYALDAEDPDETDFLVLAHKSYERIYTNIRATLKRKREVDTKTRPVGAPAQPAAAHEATTCVVCLEDDQPATTRCKRESCSAPLCLKCHHTTRGLCPICDRTAINADYPCAACGQLCRLQAYGLPCISCKSCTLCKSCYTAYEECRPCEAGAVI